jgi:hypothetical protein
VSEAHEAAMKALIPDRPEYDRQVAELIREYGEGELLAFPRTIGLEREGWDIPPEAA